MPRLLRALAVASTALVGLLVGLWIQSGLAAADDEPTVEAAIVGGQPASLSPGTVRLEVTDNAGQSWLCTGSLIAPDAVLTAAHCVTPVPTLRSIVVAGGALSIDDPAIVSTVATTVFVHPDVDVPLTGRDVAILRLEAALPVEPVSLWSPDRLPAGVGDVLLTAEIAGWGAIDPRGDIDTPVLMRATTSVLTDVECLDAWGIRYVPGEMLCTDGATPCFGDSGGPLLADLGEGRPSVGGVVSYGSAQCGLAPTVYTSVASVLDWIVELVPEASLSSATPALGAPVQTASAGYWVLEQAGDVYAFGAPDISGGSIPGGAAAIEPVAGGDGAWVLAVDGDVIELGDAPELGSLRGWLGSGERATALAGTPTGLGYWIVTDRGRAVPFGDAPVLGDVLALNLNDGVIDATASATGRGLYLVGGDGGVFALGDAAFHGSMGGTPLNAPVVGLAPTPTGLGYWLVAADGGVFAFGDATFRGSMGGTRLNQPVGGMVPYGDGYLLVAADGGVFVFSNAPFVGSLGDSPPPTPVIDVAPRPVATG
ncbi:MAG: serine protease [Actinomycetota bacterium]